MASLRGAQYLWNNVSITTNSVSALAVPGPGPYVAIYIFNNGGTACTFDIEVAADVSINAGLNAITTAADGGLVWHKLNNHTAITVASGAKIAFDLAPFSPQWVRLIRTDATGACAVTAAITSFGGD